MKEVMMSGVVLAAAAVALAGCSAAPEDTAPAGNVGTTATVTQAEQLVALIPASAETTKAVGVTQWRVMRTGADSMTYGLDANGKVVSHVATVNVIKDGLPDGVEIHAFFQETGALRLSAQSEVLGSTLTAANAQLLGRQGADVKAYQEAGGEVAFDACGAAILIAIAGCGWGATGCVVAGVFTFGGACGWGAFACGAGAYGAYATC